MAQPGIGDLRVVQREISHTWQPLQVDERGVAGRRSTERNPAYFVEGSRPFVRNVLLKPFRSNGASWHQSAEPLDLSNRRVAPIDRQSEPQRNDKDGEYQCREHKPPRTRQAEPESALIRCCAHAITLT